MQNETTLRQKLADLKSELVALKSQVDAKKLQCNGTFGKLGSPYSAIYSPDLMLAVTVTGQLNLLSLIYDIERRPSIRVLSANTDGITVAYHPKDREAVLAVIRENSVRTGFEYEETPYRKVAMKDVNNYVAITTAGKAKRKGLYAPISLMKNPTMQVCSEMAVDFLKDGTHPEESIKKYTDMKLFVSIRNVRSGGAGGIQYDHFEPVDDWYVAQDCEVVDDWIEREGIWYSPIGNKSKKSKKRPAPIEVGDRLWRRPGWPDDKPSLKRKSRPDPASVGVGGVEFGRLARWYMVKGGHGCLNYVSSGNRVPKTEGAKLCMTLPDSIPDDLDLDWYVKEAYRILSDIGAIATVSVAADDVAEDE